MDKRSWPWKKKSSDKQAAEKGSASDSFTAVSEIGETQADKDKDDKNRKPKYVQVPVECYTHLTGLEDHVKSCEEHAKMLEDDVSELNEKLSEAHSELNNKEILVKQHAKVAEEAVSGWEKAEEEAAALKNSLESVMLLKHTAEDRASHLDGALKECMRQIRNLKEEHDRKLNDLVVNKTKQFDKMKHELEAKIANLDRELLTSAAENAALSRSLNERSNMVVKLSDEKSQAEAQIEVLKTNIQSCEKEINSLKYELHIAWKEADIRNEEKNMSLRSAEAANKQHLDGVKKIAKLEAECQRLRGLVKKKLPGPAALAQMKLEVGNMGHDYGESRLRRSPGTPPHLSQLPDLLLENAQKCLKENEALTERLLEAEEEMNMLKEALAMRNGELQASRSIYAQTASKIQSLEVQLQAHRDQKRSFIEKASNPPSLTSLSEGNDDNLSCTGSCTTGLMSEFKKASTAGSPQKSENIHQELMDDFLEMEKLAHETNGVNDNVSSSGYELVKIEQSPEVIVSTDDQSRMENCLELQESSSGDKTLSNSRKHTDQPIFKKLQSEVSKALDSMDKERDSQKVLADIQHIMLVMHDILEHQLVNGVEAAQSPGSDLETRPEVCSITATQTTTEELKHAISQISGFLMNLGTELQNVPARSLKEDGLDSKLSMFYAKYGEAINREIDLIDLVLDISHVLTEASELQFNVLGFKSSEGETGSSDCIDKIALPQNKAVTDSSREIYPNGSSNFSDSASDPDVPNNGNLVPISESGAASWKCSLEEFEQLKMDNDNLKADLVKCTENFESTKVQLLETEQLLAEVKSQLISAQKSNSLAETQLKCMAQSYETLDARSEKLQSEVHSLEAKIESLENELQEERKNHQDALIRCRDLQEQLQRIESSAAADKDDKAKQERDLTAAAERLAECQETIFLLGKQLNSLRPQPNVPRLPNIRRSSEFERTTYTMPSQDSVPSETHIAKSTSLHEAEVRPFLDILDASFSPSDSELSHYNRSPVNPKYTKHRSTMSGSSSGSSSPTPEKHSRGFSRFFSSKGKHGL